MNDIILITEKYKQYESYYIERLLDNEVLFMEKIMKEDNKYYIKNINNCLNEININNIKLFSNHVQKLTKMYIKNIEILLKKINIITNYRDLLIQKLYHNLEKNNNMYFINIIVDNNINKYPYEHISKFKHKFKYLLSKYIDIIYIIETIIKKPNYIHTNI